MEDQSMDEWQFSACIEDDGDLCLEWYKSKGNIVTVCLNATAHVINWASLVEGQPHHGCIKGYPGIPALGEVKTPSTDSGEGKP
jgi:hypothetical protein